jgi:hypothetical protein
MQLEEEKAAKTLEVEKLEEKVREAGDHAQHLERESTDSQVTMPQAPGGLKVIRKEAWLFCRTSSGVRHGGGLEEPKAPNGYAARARLSSHVHTFHDTVIPCGAHHLARSIQTAWPAFLWRLSCRYVYAYIYLYTQNERARERNTEREGVCCTSTCHIAGKSALHFMMFDHCHGV